MKARHHCTPTKRGNDEVVGLLRCHALGLSEFVVLVGICLPLVVCHWVYNGYASEVDTKVGGIGLDFVRVSYKGDRGSDSLVQNQPCSLDSPWFETLR